MWYKYTQHGGGANVEKARANQSAHNGVGRKVSEMLRRAGYAPPAAQGWHRRRPKAKRAGIRTRREAVMAAAITQAAASRAHGPALAAKAEPRPGPKRLSLADLREAARRRREGAP